MNILVKFKWDCGRMGNVSALFICTKTQLEFLYHKRIYFGEILGKHSEICGKLSPEEFEIVSEDQDFINKLEVIIGSKTISGHNPLNYYDEEYAESNENL